CEHPPPHHQARGGLMVRLLSVCAFVLTLIPAVARAAGPTVQFTLPALNATPSTFGTLPFPDDLYFDQGRPGDGDGTLLDSGATIGLAVDVFRNNTDAIE